MSGLIETSTRMGDVEITVAQSPTPLDSLVAVPGSVNRRSFRVEENIVLGIDLECGREFVLEAIGKKVKVVLPSMRIKRRN